MRKINQTFSLLIPVIGLTALLIVLAGCEDQEKKKAEELRIIEKSNKDFIQAYTEDFWNNQNIAAFEKYFSTDFIIHLDDGDLNYEQFNGFCKSYFSAFPDIHITTDDLIAEEDKVTKVWTMNGTHKSEFIGVPATGNRVMIKGIEVFRIADGKIAEIWISMNNLGLMQQLGVIPPLGE